MVARDPSSYELPEFGALGDGPYPPILLEAFERASDRFERWDRQVAHTGYCCRPIRIKGKVEQVDRASGEVRTVYTTEGEPDDTLLVACGSRLASKCRSCSWWYRGDAFQVVAAGLRAWAGDQGGGGVNRCDVTGREDASTGVHIHARHHACSLPDSLRIQAGAVAGRCAGR